VAFRHFVQDEEIFLANYTDGLTDAPLAEMIDCFKKSGKVGCFIAIHPVGSILKFFLDWLD